MSEKSTSLGYIGLGLMGAPMAIRLVAAGYPLAVWGRSAAKLDAAIAAGADGLLVEVHPDPETATSDGEQSLDFAEFSDLMRALRPFAEAAGRRLPARSSLGSSPEG